MRTIIAGSRSCGNIIQVAAAVKQSGFIITSVVSGTAPGADRLGELWANLNSIPITRFPADWDKFKKAAGYIRNEEMANNADQVIVLWDGVSPGSKHMIDIATRKGLAVSVYNFKPTEKEKEWYE